MKNHITDLKIENFKSIKKAELDCRRINLIVGKPNVGKSNLLEGISMLGTKKYNQEKFLNEYIRYNKFKELFYDANLKKRINIATDIGFAYCFFDRFTNSFSFINSTNNAFRSRTNLLTLKQLKEFILKEGFSNESGIGHTFGQINPDGKTSADGVHSAMIYK